MKTLAGFRPVVNFSTPPQNFHQVVDALFNGSIANFIGNDAVASGPSVNIAENEQGFKIELAAPGFDKSNFTVNHEVEKNQLIVSAEKEKAATETAERYTRREFKTATFRRAFTLPEKIDPVGITAKYENGIMTVHVPKVAKPTPEAPRTIAIEG